MKNSFHQNTNIIGIIGHPIRHSYSPFVHNITIEILGLDYIYLPFDIPASNLRNALKGMVALNIKGCNITIPHKESCLQFLHNVSEEAGIVGAVNTIVNDSGKLTGYNTDVHGVMEALFPYKDEIVGQTISVFGAGGAARSVLYTLIRHFKPKRINIINRTDQRGDTLKTFFQSKMRFDSIKSYELIPPDIVSILADSKLLINATSIGMFPEVDDSVTILQDSFQKNQLVFDLVYNPTETKLLKLAKESGAKTIDGLQMLVHQAAKSFEIWTGEKMPVSKILKALRLYITT